MTEIIDGKAIAEKVQAHIFDFIQEKRKRPPGLAFILVGENPASKSYIAAKKKKCLEVGIQSFDHIFTEEISEAKLLSEIEHLNSNPAVDGILVQLPLPAHINTQKIMEAIVPDKDVD